MCRGNIWKKILREWNWKWEPKRQSNWWDYAKSNKPVTRQQYGNHKKSARKVDLLGEKRKKSRIYNLESFLMHCCKLHRCITLALPMRAIHSFELVQTLPFCNPCHRWNKTNVSLGTLREGLNAFETFWRWETYHCDGFFGSNLLNQVSEWAKV